VLDLENRAIVGRLLEDPALELVPSREIWGLERARALGDGDFLEVTPHRHGTDGFFAAVVRRRRNLVMPPREGTDGLAAEGRSPRGPRRRGPSAPRVIWE